MPGFPIRTSSDPRSVDNSPRHIAASHVLHRLPVPRHPPCALKHLHTKQIKILGRIQKIALSHNKPPPNREAAHCEMLATTIHKSNTTPHHQRRGDNKNPQPHQPTVESTAGARLQRDQRRGLVVSKPNSVSGSPITAHPIRRLNPVAAQRLLCTRPAPLQPPAPSRLGYDPVSQPFSWCSLERR